MFRTLKITIATIVFLIAISAFSSWYGINQAPPVQPNLPRVSDSVVFLNARFISVPEHITFAGEPMPLGNPDVWERMDRELYVNTYWHSNTILMLKKAHRWLPMISRELKKAGVPDDFKYLVAIETNFKNDISPANAVGFWQFLKASGLEQGLEITSEVDERYHPQKATQAAAAYLKNAHDVLGNWTLAAAAYNRGVRGISKALQQQKENDYYRLLLNEETSRYVFRIVAAKLIIENPGAYGFQVNPEELYQPFNTQQVEVTQSIPNLVDWAQAHHITYRQLKRYNPWLRATKLTVSPGKTYVIALPE